LADDLRLRLAAVSFRQRFFDGSGRIIFLTGPRGSGKSSRCAEFTALARAYGVAAGGLLSIPVFDSGVKAAIDLMDVGSGAVHRFARRTDPDVADVGHWKLEEGVLDWANSVLRSARGVSLLLVDELGPMELEAGKGLTGGMEALDEGSYSLALVVVRPEMIPLAVSRWPRGEVVEVGEFGRPLWEILPVSAAETMTEAGT